MNMCAANVLLLSSKL